MMLPHPDTLKTVSDLQWNDRLRTADRERLATLACARPSSPSAFAEVLALVARVSANFLSVAATAIVTPRRALPALLVEKS